MVDRGPRKYELRKRADAMADTRRRITEAAVALHGSVGPARTTVAAIAEHAGVQRHTVYRHFPTDEDLFAACTTHYWALHPWPDPDGWAAIADPRERLVVAMGELYAFYVAIEPMMTNVVRDAPVLPLVEQALGAYLDYADGIAAGLGEAAAPGRPLTVAAVRHAIDFRTWQSLVARGGLDPSDAIALMAAMVDSSVSPVGAEAP
jgi:AcrR family transcriptional regulator